MNRKKILLYSGILVAVIVLISALLAKNGNITAPSEVLASFDGSDGREEITRDQLNQRIALLQLLYPQLSDTLNASAEGRINLEQQILAGMIDSGLHRKATIARGLDVNEKNIDIALEGLVAHIYSSTPATSPEALVSLGIAESALRGYVTETAHASALFSFFQEQVTEDRIRQFWDKNPDIKTVPAMINFTHVLVATKPEATEMRTRIIAGEDIGNIAATYSIEPGADMSRGMRFAPINQAGEPALMTAIAALEIGGISQPVETSLGWHIIQLISRTKATELTFKDARTQIIGHVAYTDFMDYVTTLHEAANIQNNMLTVPEQLP
ncbi:MAG: Foldase protein PrsA [Syntrophomonadaceae bacterium]|nr:Foldase protein PrsA [Bacillota bacterium]